MNRYYFENLEASMFRSRATISASAICFSLMILSNTSVAAPIITWEVENGFRYFKRANDYREILRIYNSEKSAANPKPTALQLESALEKVAAQQGEFNGIEGNDRRLGWAASIYLHTCARQPDHMHRNCELEDHESYLEPKGTRIILHVGGVASGNCEWKIDGAVVGTAKCNDADNTGLLKPVTTKVSYNEKHSVTVAPSSGAAIVGEIIVKDILIVSFGDSFSAGEGNPEKPVNFSNDFADYGESSRHGRGLFKIVDNFPVRPPGPQFWKDSAANWTNSQCHRSLYSQHTKAALQYSLEHPHLTVTYLNYSCTGAEVYEGILNAWWARDVENDLWDDAPQMVKALRDLCDDPAAYKETQWSKGDRKDADFDSKIAAFARCGKLNRKIDALLLSIGGNDIGFANMIVNSAINAQMSDPRFLGARPWVYGLWRAVAKPETYATGKAKAKSLIPPRYRVLSKQLNDYLEVAPEKVVLSAYPDVSTDEKGNTCQAPNVGMDVHSIFAMNNPRASDDSEAFVDFLHDFMRDQASSQKWNFADQHLQAGSPNNFKGHGLCAKNEDALEAASMKFPRPTLPGSPPFQWKPFIPEHYSPYTTRNRWLVTPNDAYLTTNYLDPHRSMVDPVQPVYASTLSGAFHPNALGHAALADSVLVQLRRVLKDYDTQ
jgi:hypothetical protein